MCFVIHTLRSLDCKEQFCSSSCFGAWYLLVPLQIYVMVESQRREKWFFCLFLNSLVTRHGSFFWAVFTLNIWRVSLKLRCGLGSPGAGRIGTWCHVAPRGCCTQLALCLWKSGLTSRFLSTTRTSLPPSWRHFGGLLSLSSQRDLPQQQLNCSKHQHVFPLSTVTHSDSVMLARHE